MQNRATQLLEHLSSASVITADRGFTVESRISYGVHGDDDELAFSVEWRDAEGCLWAADFSEIALAQAEISGSAVSLCDTDGTKLVLRLYQPQTRISLPPHPRK